MIRRRVKRLLLIGNSVILFLYISSLNFLFPPLYPDEFKYYPNYCDFSIEDQITSSRRDVLLLSADKFSPGLELAIMSLRSTGSQCRIVILSSEEIKISNQTKLLFDRLDVEIYDNCTNKNTSRENVPHMIRYEFEREWIRQNINDTDRIFHTDAFDVYFQRDPFTNLFVQDKLRFVIEPHYFRSCGWNQGWYKDCYGGEKLERVMNNFIVCSGSIIGDAKVYLKLLDLMIESEEWKRCWRSSFDQPILNHLIWENKLADNKIAYDFTACNGGFLTYQWCIIDYETRLNEKQEIITMINTTPAYVHQYNRNKEITKIIFHKCGKNRSK